MHNNANYIGRAALGLPTFVYQPRVDLSSPWAIEEAKSASTASERARQRARQKLNKTTKVWGLYHTGDCGRSPGRERSAKYMGSCPQRERPGW